MSTLLYNPYIVKWSTKGEGGDEKVQKTVYVGYERPPLLNENIIDIYENIL